MFGMVGVVGTYRSVLALPGAAGFVAAGFLARLPMSMVSLGTVLLVERVTGSYGAAGAVAGTSGLCTAVLAPRLARLVDRHGQAWVLRPAAVTCAAALVALVLLAVLGAPVVTLFAAAVLAGGSTLSVGTLVRARWSALLGGDPRLHTAFSLESVLDELIFIVGPILVTVLATRLHPAAGLLVAAAAGLAGSLALARQRTSQPRASPPDGQHAAPLLAPGLLVLVATFLAAGGIFGSTEVVVVAFTEAAGSPGSAGAVLATWAFGSMVAGLAYGAVQWQGRADRRFAVVVALLALGTLPMALAPSVPVLAGAMLVAGMAISPVIVTGFALVEATVPRARLTEGLTWVTTGLNLAAAAAAAVAGVAIDAYGPSRAFLVTVSFGVLGAAVALTGARWLRSAPAAQRVAGSRGAAEMRG